MASETNPGSEEAVAAGCKCPVLDNGHGKGIYGGGVKNEKGKVIFWINEDCPLHGGFTKEAYKCR